MKSKLAMMALMICVLPGCKNIGTWDQELKYIKTTWGDKTRDEITRESAIPTNAVRTDVIAPVDDDQGSDLPIDVVWHGPDIGAWKAKYDLSIKVTASKIRYTQVGTSRWPTFDYSVTVTSPITGFKEKKIIKLVGNFWVIVRIEIDGVLEWHGFTHEWAKPGQQLKNKSSINYAHLDGVGSLLPRDWKPKAGDLMYGCVSGAARGGRENVQERTVLAPYVWQ